MASCFSLLCRTLFAIRYSTDLQGDIASNVVFFENNKQKKIIQKSVVEIEKRFNSKVVTLLWKFEKFYKAEDYHQDYYQKNFLRYLTYKKACQREEVLNKIWN